VIIRPLLLAAASAALQWAAFPPLGWWPLAWIALVPWLLLLRHCTLRSAFWWSALIGFAFFLASIHWLIYVTLPGWIILCAVMGVFTGLFGMLACTIGSPDGRQGLSLLTARVALLLLPAAWVAVEYVRSYIFTGFGWNLLAYSQTPWRLPLQVADTLGAWGVSFLIVMVNVAMASLLVRDVPWGARTRHLALAAAALLAAGGYGAWRIPQARAGALLRVAVVQGNIPQDRKWNEEYQGFILDRYAALTQVAKATEPHLVVWPETSVPGYLDIDEDITQRIIAIAKALGRPMLVGTPRPTLVDARVLLRNTAVLLDGQGRILTKHDKLHLVPFGEFVPFDDALPWLRRMLPEIGRFTSGTEPTVFTAPGTAARFGVLICFEDVFPALARRFVQRGAQALLVITNDAWFGPTAAAIQHAQASTLRAVELRVPIARAANTGWSGCIDASGAWLGQVEQLGRPLFVDGTYTCDLPAGPGGSLYRLWGDWFAVLCLATTAGWALLQRFLL